MHELHYALRGVSAPKCVDPVCRICGSLECAFGDPRHYGGEGCPSCSSGDAP